MRACFALVLSVVASTVLAGEVSVLNHGEPAPAVAAAPAAQAAPAATACACASSNKCCGERLYSVEESDSASCRNRLFGGYVVRKNSRTVYRPVRR